MRMASLCVVAGLCLSASGCTTSSATLCWTNAESGWRLLRKPPEQAVAMEAMANASAPAQSDQIHLWFRASSGHVYLCRLEPTCNERNCKAERFEFHTEGEGWRLADEQVVESFVAE